MKINDFTNFEKLVAPSVIKLVYWIGIVVLFVWGIGGVLAGLFFQGSILHALLILASAVVGFLVWRVMCEIYIVVFGIFERLGEIRDRLPASRPDRAPPPL